MSCFVYSFKCAWSFCYACVFQEFQVRANAIWLPLIAQNLQHSVYLSVVFLPEAIVLRWQSQIFEALCCLRVTRLFVYIMRSYVVEYSSYMSHVMVGVPRLVQIALLLNCIERCLVSTVMDWCLSMWLGCFLCRRFQPGQVSCSNRKKFQPARKRLQWSV